MLRREDFAGTWRLTRRIDDWLAGQIGKMQGTALFLPDGENSLIYDETGQMTLGAGPTLTATRRYLWQFGEEMIDVSFADGREFHRFIPTGAAAGTDHPCGADHYRVRYDFTCWPQWSAVWTVRGPRKNYVSETDYVRGG